MIPNLTGHGSPAITSADWIVHLIAATIRYAVRCMHGEPTWWITHDSVRGEGSSDVYDLCPPSGARLLISWSRYHFYRVMSLAQASLGRSPIRRRR